MKALLASYGSITTGLGAEARWLIKTLPFTRWLKVEHPKLGFGDEFAAPPNPPEVVQWACRFEHAAKLDAALDGIDTLVLIERPLPPEIVQIAKKRNVRVIMLANPEWTSLGSPWVGGVSTLVARTDQALRRFRDLGLGDFTLRADVPIALDEFPFVMRHSARRLTWSDGWGGVADRKGKAAIDALLALRPGISNLSTHSLRLGHGVVTESRMLYENADVVLMPSRYEGLGLTLLEAMACGALVLCTDAEPMRSFVGAAQAGNELCSPEDFLIPYNRTGGIDVGGQPWRAHEADPVAMLALINRWAEAPEHYVREASLRGRRYVERTHGRSAALRLWRIICGES